jgi:hypothetical protein
MSVLDALELAQVLGVPAPEVAAAVTWAEREGLNDQYAQGAISLDELERRSTLALTGRTRGELAAATAGLEVPGPPGAGSLQTTVRTFLLVAGGLLALGIVMITLLVLLVLLVRS